MNRVYNFNPGPAVLPLPVLTEIKEQLPDFNGTGMSIMETSHRSPEVEGILDRTQETLKELLGLDHSYQVLFLQGGASLQFSMVPLNFLPSGATADYLLTGIFAEKAYEEALLLGKAKVAATTKDDNYTYIPTAQEIHYSEEPAYIHLTSNNTIVGTQWQEFPQPGVPLVADMSSDILSRRFDARQFALIYAGAQKNLGPAGVTIVIIRSDLLDRVPSNLPSMLRYDIHAKNKSLYNTPPVFAIHVLERVLNWVKNSGGLDAMEKQNLAKASMLYRAMDESEGFYRGHARKESRSLMNVTFRLRDENLEKLFVSQASHRGLVGLKGHRSVGGIRASIYNAMSHEGCAALAEFMEEFKRGNR